MKATFRNKTWLSIFIVGMLQFKQDETDSVMILTLTELVSVAPLYYLFIFTHVETKNVVSFVKAEADDESSFPQRYNQFTINAVTVFDGKPTGEWHYTIYEQDEPGNLDPNQTNGLLEQGKLILDRANSFEYDQYDSATSYKSYNG